MPDLIGVNGDRAADLPRSHGFRVSVVGDRVSRHPGRHRPATELGFQIGNSDRFRSR
jgi:hypothetical protein